MIANF